MPEGAGAPHAPCAEHVPPRPGQRPPVQLYKLHQHVVGLSPPRAVVHNHDAHHSARLRRCALCGRRRCRRLLCGCCNAASAAGPPRACS